MGRTTFITIDVVDAAYSQLKWHDEHPDIGWGPSYRMVLEGAANSLGLNYTEADLKEWVEELSIKRGHR